MQAILSQWLRLLWNLAPPLRLDSDAPHIASGAICLPARSHWRLHSAAAAHAAAHLVYSPSSFDGTGLGPIARALTALLEDARVEALAMRELPGLARLWQPLHTATPALGADFEALLQRLARSLIDPCYDDPDAWVRKGRGLFYLDAGLGLPALRTPAEVRRAAMRLGHDIGQMRLQFNARTHRPQPPYRDDHRWMWAADASSAAMPPPAAMRPTGSVDDAAAPDTTEAVTLHPEWDHLIARARPDWCRVIEGPAQPVARSPSASGEGADDAAVRQTGRRLRVPLRTLTRQTGARRRSDEGDVFDLDALVGWRLARRLQQPGDARVYRGAERRSTGAAVWLLVDQSASSSAAGSGSSNQGSILQTATRATAAAAEALAAIRVPFAVVGFSSYGRHAVRLVTVKAFDEPWVPARLQALQPGGSTRLGAALRHATRCVLRRAGGPRWVLVLSDGEPHDIDVHDPRYLIEDARRAVRDAARRSVRVACLLLGGGEGDTPRIPHLQRTNVGRDARRIFGPHGADPLPDLASLPGTLRRLLTAAAR